MLMEPWCVSWVGRGGARGSSASSASSSKLAGYTSGVMILRVCQVSGRRRAGLRNGQVSVGARTRAELAGVGWMPPGVRVRVSMR